MDIKLYTTKNVNCLKILTLLQFLRLDYHLYDLQILPLGEYEPDHTELTIQESFYDDLLLYNLKDVISGGETTSSRKQVDSIDRPILSYLDHNNVMVTIDEPASIMLFLCDKYDTSRKYSYDHKSPYFFESMSWILWQLSSVYTVGYKSKPLVEKAMVDDIALIGFKKDIQKVYHILNNQLIYSKSGFLVGDHISVVDLLCYPFIKATIEVLQIKSNKTQNFTCLHNWFDKLSNIREIENCVIDSFRET